MRENDHIANTNFCQAIVRKPARSLGSGITTAEFGVPDFEKAEWQFAMYVQALEDCGLTVTVLDPLEEFPDAHFVEDTAVVLPDAAILCRPGAASRRGEAEHMAPVLSRQRELTRINEPGTLDGGDVLLVGTHCLIGLSDRTNKEGATQLGSLLSDHGYTWQTVPVGAGLHFKSSVNHVGNGTLLVSEEFAGNQALARFDQIVVDPAEQYACNTLLLNDRLLLPSGFPDTRRKLETLGLPIFILSTSEFRKMDGGLTCLSLRF
ncbi:MAG: hypothetical protein KOO60_00210 [Gemmatimonadales bacterium]|nr:hypothetical protein [Gemmatimonadales bacterium]